MRSQISTDRTYVHMALGFCLKAYLLYKNEKVSDHNSTQSMCTQPPECILARLDVQLTRDHTKLEYNACSMCLSTACMSSASS